MGANSAVKLREDIGRYHPAVVRGYLRLQPRLAKRVCLAGDLEGITMRLRALIIHFTRDESAATAIEYGLIAAGIAVAIIAAVKGVGTKLNTTFATVSTGLR
jgi:pilus assembly protein Flp/PilA